MGLVFSAGKRGEGGLQAGVPLQAGHGDAIC